MKKTANKIILLALLLLVAAGCDKDGMHIASKSKLIRPKVSGVSLTKTATGEPARKQIGAIPISEDPDNPLYVLVFEQDMAERDAMVQATKGTVVTSDNIEEFYMNAYAEGEWHDNETNVGYMPGPYFGGVKVTKTGPTDHPWVMEEDKYWLNDVKLSFWSSNEDLSVLSLGFEVDGTDYSKASLSYAIDHTVTDESDLIFAYNRENRKFNESGEIEAGIDTSSRSDEYVDIHFYHALSAIRFDVSGVVDAGSTVNKITLSNIYVQGDCSIDASSGTPVFSWNLEGKSKNGSAQQTFSGSDFNSDGSYKAGTDKEYLMLPQTLTSDATITVWFDGSATGIAKPLGTTTWLPGKYYTYKLSRHSYEDYSFEVTDLSDNPVSELTFNNTTAPGLRQIKILESDKIGEKALAYSVEYSTDGGATWTPYDYSDVKISGFEASGNPGVLAGTDDPIIVDLIADPRTKTTEMYRWKNRAGESDMTGSKSAPIDLSMMPIGGDGNGTSPMNTANSYIVKHPGYYKFPCVYGNAIKDGATNTSGYITSVTGSNVLSNFLNASGTGISDPYVITDLGLSPSSVKASLVWCDFIYGKDLLVQNVELSSDGKYISFNTLHRDDLVEGNAVIALYTDNNSNGKYDEGEALWSWQIWISDSNLADYNVGEVGSEGGAFGHYYFMSRTLGYCYDIPSVGMTQVADEFKEFKLRLIQEESGLTRIIDIRQPDTEDYGIPQNAPYYEWGRKDPFVAGYKLNNGFSGFITDKAFYDAERNSLSVATAGQDLYPNDNASSTISNSIKNPGTFCTQSSFDNTFNNLWITDNNSTLNFSKQPLKTVYDPSPYGYVIPNSEAFGNFANGDAVGTTPYPINGEWNNTLNGCLINNSDGVKDDNLFFPALFRRNCKDGNLEQFTTCYYWSSIQNSNKMGLAFWDYYHNDVITAGPFSRSYGFSVRPILEGTEATPPAVILIDPNDWHDGGGNIGF